MSYLRTFLPWILFWLVPSGSWQWGALAALVVAVGVIVTRLRAGAAPDALIIEIGSAAFFGVLAAIAFADPHSGMHAYSATISSGVLAVIAGLSLAIGRPFTLGIAKRTTPREFWEVPLFIRTNVIITSVWTAGFAVTAATLGFLAYGGQAHSTVAILIQVAGFVVPMVFTLRYVAAVQAKAAAAQGLSALPSSRNSE